MDTCTRRIHRRMHRVTMYRLPTRAAIDVTLEYRMADMNKSHTSSNVPRRSCLNSAKGLLPLFDFMVSIPDRILTTYFPFQTVMWGFGKKGLNTEYVMIGNFTSCVFWWLEAVHHTCGLITSKGLGIETGTTIFRHPVNNCTCQCYPIKW